MSGLLIEGVVGSGQWSSVVRPVVATSSPGARPRFALVPPPSWATAGTHQPLGPASVQDGLSQRRLPQQLAPATTITTTTMVVLQWLNDCQCEVER